MVKFLKALGIYIVLFVVLFIVALVVSNFAGEKPGSELFLNIIMYGGTGVGIIVFFFFFVSVASDLDKSSFWVDFIAYIIGGVGYLLIFKGFKAYGIICILLCCSITSLGACGISDRLLSYYEESVNREYRWNDFIDKWEEIEESTLIRFVDNSYVGYILHLLIFLLPCFFKDPVYILVCFIILSVRFVLRNILTIGTLIFLFFYNIFHPLNILSFMGRFWYVFGILLIAGGVAIAATNGAFSKKDKDTENSENYENKDIVFTPSHYYEYSPGYYTTYPSCNMFGQLKFACENNPSASKQYATPEFHRYNSNNVCEDCRYTLTYSLDKLLYTTITPDQGDPYIEIYAYLPGTGNLIIPPYIDGKEVRNIHISAYDPNYDKESFKENYKHGDKIAVLNNDVTNIYGESSYEKIYVYSANKKTNVYIDQQYGEEIKELYVIGSINTFFIRQNPAKTIYFLHDIVEFYSIATDECNLIFGGDCRTFYSKNYVRLMDCFACLPKHIEYFYAGGNYYGFHIKNSAYFKTVGNDLYTYNSVFHGFGEALFTPETEDDPATNYEILSDNIYKLREGSILFNLDDYSYDYYDYRFVDGGFQLGMD